MIANPTSSLKDQLAATSLAKYNVDELLESFKTNGYFVVDGIFDDFDMDALRNAVAEAVTMTREGKWPHRRTTGKAFPPYDMSHLDSWGVQHLMHPELPHHELFAKFYGSPQMLGLASLLLDAPTERLQMELFNLLINPKDHAFALVWHRDDIRPDVDGAEERALLDTKTYGIQWNAALYDDECLFVVPGTHDRIRTESEVIANKTAVPPAKLIKEMSPEEVSKLDGSWDVDPPGTLRVRLKAGQTAFYSQRILHRASYVPTAIRATLHGAYGDMGPDWQVGSETRARNFLQHQVDWMTTPEFGEKLPDSLKPMWKNYMRTQQKYAGVDLGFSLDG
ncbi:hypothetical protein MNV49_001485 [Pseudohyphozyma bogoriensis]|nr:hypothetical protein MNV49_001485 [Pseudohyphozyma bogoriensis]